MPKSKIYAVKKGFKTGLFYSWEECKEATNGFSGPIYKSFESEEEAQAFLDDVDVVMENDIMPRLQKGSVVAFTDGSFDSEKNAYGSGVCIFTPSENNVELSMKGNNQKYIDLRNIAGEIIAVLNAVDWAWKNGYDNVTVFYDYEGIGKWASGEWKAKKSLTDYYKRYIDEKKEIINIEFVKVSGHSNNKYNDRADKLAKSAIFDNKIIKDYGSNSGYIISPVSNNDVERLLNEVKEEYTGIEYQFSTGNSKKTWTVSFEQDKLSLSLFNDIKMVVQGKNSNLFQIITTAIMEKISCGDFVQVLRSAYSISINKADLNDDYLKMLPTIASKKLPEHLQTLIKQAIINLKNPAKGDIEFSMYTLPALKALEGVLKYNLNSCGIPMRSHSFNMFDFDDNKKIYYLKTEYLSKCSKNNVAKLENCYNYLYNQRHTLFHFGMLLFGKDVNTRLINTKKEADMLIEDTLKVIDQNYI